MFRIISQLLRARKQSDLAFQFKKRLVQLVFISVKSLKYLLKKRVTCCAKLKFYGPFDSQGHVGTKSKLGFYVLFNSQRHI